MYTLSPFWSASATLSGAVDFSGLERADATSWTTAALQEAGLQRVSTRLARALHSTHPVLRLCDAQYPEHLAVVPYAPPVLFCEGDRSLLQRPGVAIVGARRCTTAGFRT